MRIGRERKRLAHLKTNYEQLCAKFEQRIEAELRADEDAGLKMRLLDDFLPVLHRLLCVMIDKLNTEDRKLFNSAFTAAPLYRIAREMGFESVKDYLIAYRKVTRRLPESSDELIKRLQTDLERSRDSFKEMEHTLLRARQNHEDANRMCSDLRDKEIYYIERCERLKEKNRENEKRVERLKNDFSNGKSAQTWGRPETPERMKACRNCRTRWGICISVKWNCGLSAGN